MIKSDRSKLYTLLTTLLFLLSLSVITFIRADFVNNQLEKVSKTNPSIIKAGIAWPRLISEPNDLPAFNDQLGDLRSESNFLIFRQLSDSRGVDFILLGAKNYQEYFASDIGVEPTKCDQSLCEVIAALPNGAALPDLSAIGMKVVGSGEISKQLPIPADFGVNKKLPILITPFIDQLSIWQPFRYLPATYGWQVTHKDISNLSASAYKEELVAIEGRLNANFANVAVNYPVESIDSLIKGEDKIRELSLNAAKTILLIFTLCIFLIWQRFKFKRLWLIVGASCTALLIAYLWDYLALIQIVIFLLLFALLLYLINKVVEKRLVDKDLNTLALYRSSLTQTLSIIFLLGLTFSVIISANQYLDRTKQLRSAVIDQKVPLDYTLKIGPSLNRPLDLGSLRELSQLPGVSEVVPVIRKTATLINTQGDERQINLIAKGGPLWSEPALSIGSSKELTINTAGIAKEIELIIWLRGENDNHFAVITTGSEKRVGVVPRDRVGENFIVAFELKESSANATLREHALGESDGRAFDVLSGQVRILSITADKRQIQFDKSWPISNFNYALLDGPVILRPQITVSEPNLLFSDDIKDDIAEITLDQVSISPVKYQRVDDFVAGEKPFVVMDLKSYQELLGATEPYGLDPLEIWVKAGEQRNFESIIASSKFNSLQLISREKLITNQANTPYWASWQLLFFTCLIFIFALSLLPLIRLALAIRDNLNRFRFEMSTYFDTTPPSLKPFIFIFIVGLISALPILYLSRVISGVIS